MRISDWSSDVCSSDLLTARDPYFILPVLNIAIMWSTQKLTPMSGMDPMQQKMMQTMPLIFGVVLAFLPAGLVLYQVANGGLGRSEEHTSELQSLMRISYAVFRLKKKKTSNIKSQTHTS